jgi:membrane-associated PAP2 superfamily phosphatase
LAAYKQIYAALGALAICLAWFELTPTDLWLQSLFFNQVSQQWLWSRTEPVGQLLLYDGIKALIIGFGIVLLGALIASIKLAALKQHTRGIRILLLSLILVPACIGGLKSVTNIACPRDLADFGGAIPYTGFFRAPISESGRFKQQRCFPAGHASGGFALLALPFLFSSRRNKQAAISVALALGWAMGGYKIIIGDHFLSHTITTMLLAWLIINMIVVAEAYFVGQPLNSGA